MNSRYFKINVWIMKFVISFFLILSVVIGGIALFSTKGSGEGGEWMIIAVVAVVWFLAFIFFLANLILFTDFREYVLTKMTKSEPKDEREALLDGLASKKSFLSTLAVIIVVLFLSLFRLTLINPTDLERESGQKGILSLGFQTEFLVNNKTSAKEMSIDQIYSTDKGISIRYKGIPLDPSVLIFLILFWHMGSYYYFTRKLK